MYVSTFNPNQAVAFGQGYQSGATAFPVSIRTGLPGNSVTYSFHPALSSAALAMNPAFSQGWAFPAVTSPINFPSQAWAMNPWMPFNPLINQALAFSPAAASTGFLPNVNVNPVFNPAGMAINPALNYSLAFHPAMLSGAAFTFAGAPFFAGQVPAAQTIQSSAGMAQMRVDLAETNSDVVVACELPNVSLNDLSLTVTDDSMTISATAWAGNRPTSLFRTIALPTSIRSEQVEATYANGILEIRAPKSDVATRRKVKINVAQ